MSIFGLGRKPFPLTDEQVIREAMKTVTAYARRHPGDTFDTDECVRETVRSVETVWKKERGYLFGKRISRRDAAEYAALLARVREPLEERTRERAAGHFKRRKVQQINRITIEAVIASGLRERDQRYFFEDKQHHLQVTVMLSHGRAMSFNIADKGVAVGDLDRIIDSIARAAEAVNEVDVPVNVWLMPEGMENWNGWK
jgi:hypothetical protein